MNEHQKQTSGFAATEHQMKELAPLGRHIYTQATADQYIRTALNMTLDQLVAGWYTLQSVKGIETRGTNKERLH